jgi:hypothetical protein
VQAGPEGLFDRTRARHQDPQRILPELKRAVLSIRRRLQVHAAPATRYCLIGATAIRAELKALAVCPLSCGRTTELATCCSDQNWARLTCPLADVRLQLCENFMMGLGRFAGDATLARLCLMFDSRASG